MIDKLQSRKFWALIVTALLTTLGQGLGLGADSIEWLVAIAGSFVVGQGIADFGSQGRVVVEKLKSRKLWAYVLGSVVIAAGDGLGLSPDISKWLSLTISTYLIGQGIADAGAQGNPFNANR